MSALQLPALAIEAKAELITNNLPAFEEAFRAGLDGLKYELLNDDDFAKAKEDIKTLKAAEKTIAEVDQAIVNGSADIKTIRESLASLSEDARQFRLSREKEIKARDAELKAKVIADALALIDHPKREKFREMVQGGAKGKRTFATMKKGADSVAESIAANIAAARDALAQFEKEHGSTLIPDRLDLELQPASNVEDQLRFRLEKQRDEEEKKRLKEEAEKARQEAEAAAKAKEEAESAGEVPAGNDQRDAHTSPAPLSQSEAPRTPSGGLESIEAPGSEGVVSRGSETAKQELDRYLDTLRACLAPIREARQALKHAENIKRIEEFAGTLNAAFLKLKGGNS